MKFKKRLIVYNHAVLSSSRAHFPSAFVSLHIKQDNNIILYVVPKKRLGHSKYSNNVSVTLKLL